MADTVVSVFNQALGACKVRASIASETENSPELRVCVLWYETILKQVLRAAPWPAASSYMRLAAFAENEDETWVPGSPAPGYRYSYNLPADMVRPRALTTWEPFEISQVGNRARLSTNTIAPILSYTSYLTDITQWDDSFRLAVVFGLAAVISGKLTGSQSLGRELQSQANQLIVEAQVSAANSDEETYEAVPEWLSARGFGNVSSQKFIYPNGALLMNVGGSNGS